MNHLRRACTLLAVAAALSPMVGVQVSPAEAAPARVAPRVVPDAPSLHVATSLDASDLAAALRTLAGAWYPTVGEVSVDRTGFAYTRLNDLDQHDTAVGYGAESTYKGASRDLILARGGSTQVIGRTGAPDPLGDRSAQGNAINESGVVTGVAPCQCNRVPAGVPASVAFRWSAADGFSFAPMPPGVVASTGVAVNDAGLILVNSWASPSPQDDGAWLWDPAAGTLVKLAGLGGGAPTGTALNDDGTVVGSAPVGSVSHAVLWRRGRHHAVVDLTPGSEGMAFDINRDGTVVGFRGGHAMAWWANGKRSRDLGEGRAYAVNDHDQVAGNQVLAHVVPDDGGPPSDVVIPAVYDLWEPTHRVVLPVEQLAEWSPVRLNDHGYVVNVGSVFGPAPQP